jgi:hypothetical protein
MMVRPGERGMTGDKERALTAVRAGLRAVRERFGPD